MCQGRPSNRRINSDEAIVFEGNVLQAAEPRRGRGTADEESSQCEKVIHFGPPTLVINKSLVHMLRAHELGTVHELFLRGVGSLDSFLVNETDVSMPRGGSDQKHHMII